MASIFSRVTVGFSGKSSNFCIYKTQSKLLCVSYVEAKSPVSNRHYSKDLPGLNELEFDESYDNEAMQEKEMEIERSRNKSRLDLKHQNVLYGKMPYDEPAAWFHHSVKYKKRMFGLYGLQSDIPLGILWPTKEELEDKKEYERVKLPHTLQETKKNIAKKKKEEELFIQKRQADIVAKYAKLDQWKREVNQKIEKKLQEAEASKQKKERLVEEVRRHFGYNVDPREDKFKEMLEQKEKEENKLLKEAKKKAKQDKMMQKLLQKSTEDSGAMNKEKPAAESN